MQDIIILSLLWLCYFSIHSAMASLRVKSAVQRICSISDNTYRFLFNLVSVVLLIPIAWILLTTHGQMLWRWDGVLRPIQFGVTIVVLLGIYWSSSAYDMKAFLGLRRFTQTTASEPFGLSGFHRIVRHPWYTLILLYIWTRDMDILFFVSAVLMSVYFWFGSILEERKLVRLYGLRYKTYMQKVPGLIPLPHRRISKREAEDILNLENK